MALTEYDIQHVTQKAIKGSELYDYLAHKPLEGCQSMRFEYPEEGLEPESRWTLVFDEASNAHGNGIEAIITSPNGFHLPFTARLCFECTNNMAEYEACIFGIETTIYLRIKTLDVYRDSALVISQVKGDWEAINYKLIPYKEHVLKLILYFDEITFHHIPREEKSVGRHLSNSFIHL
ncbi:uncharacterized protein LOC127095900 [Lathyrus oleraceus]|uniref:uncharacterized protein LOC127095900 n=1 Tax=Pisum sativum TaxID=3888 RepID=UPI0021D324E6|nr:uncharacterized protein LOC127095900 [Pisum sativum]